MALESYAIAKDVLKRIKGPVEVQVYPSCVFDTLSKSHHLSRGDIDLELPRLLLASLI